METSIFRMTGPLWVKSPVIGGFPSQMASNAELFSSRDTIMFTQDFSCTHLLFIAWVGGDLSGSAAADSPKHELLSHVSKKIPIYFPLVSTYRWPPTRRVSAGLFTVYAICIQLSRILFWCSFIIGYWICMWLTRPYSSMLFFYTTRPFTSNV